MISSLQSLNHWQKFKKKHELFKENTYSKELQRFENVHNYFVCVFSEIRALEREDSLIGTFTNFTSN